MRYTFFNDGPVAVYVAGGVRYPICAGDLAKNGQIGPTAAVGVIFSHDKPVQWGFEAGYDWSKVKIENGSYSATVQPYKIMAGIFVRF